MSRFGSKSAIKGFAIGALALALLCVVGARPAVAAPMYLTGNECPTDASMAGFDRQYSIPQAVACIYDDSSSNITGTASEADMYLNSATAQPTWGTGWTGLGVDPVGFSFTADVGADDGTFAIATSMLAYDQFAVAVKDGGSPKWALFLLPVYIATGDWHFMSPGGELGHFALFGHNVADAQNASVPDVPEPASILLLGSGIACMAAKARNRRPS